MIRQGIRKKYDSLTLAQKIIILVTFLAAIAPTLLISMLSYTYYRLGIEDLFNEKISKSIAETVYVAESYLKEHKENIKYDSLSIAQDIERNSAVLIEAPNQFTPFLNKQAELRKLSELCVFSHEEGIIAKSSFALSLMFEKISDDDLAKADQGEVVIIQSSNERVRALVKLNAFYKHTYLIIGKYVDTSIIENLRATKGSADQYKLMQKELKSAQVDLEYGFILISAFMLILSIALAIRLAKVIIKPINNLVDAIDSVLKGDFDVKVPEKKGMDETAVLSRAFNKMVSTIAKQREKLIKYNVIIDQRRKFIEKVLSEISAGVLTINNKGQIEFANTAAKKLLGLRTSPKGQRLHEMLPDINDLIEHVSNNIDQIVSKNVQLKVLGKTIHLFVRVGAIASVEKNIDNYIVTFDDFTDLVSAQRAAAWGDVARRIAHEIKNPLTPIQLAAERLGKKFAPADKIESEQFNKYISTIIKHVTDIERIVEEFIHFARIPMPKKEKLNLNNVINQVVFSQQNSFKKLNIKFLPEIDAAMVYCDPTQITQVLMNLIKNSAESVMQKFPDDELAQGQILVTFAGKNSDTYEVKISDNGLGFDQSIIDRIAEPYVTTKEKGTGLGLSIVKKIIEDHGGFVSFNNQEVGAVVAFTIKKYKE